MHWIAVAIAVLLLSSSALAAAGLLGTALAAYWPFRRPVGAT